MNVYARTLAMSANANTITPVSFFCGNFILITSQTVCGFEKYKELPARPPAHMIQQRDCVYASDLRKFSFDAQAHLFNECTHFLMCAAPIKLGSHYVLALRFNGRK